MNKITWNSCPVCLASPNKKGNCKPKKQNNFEKGIGNYYIWCDNCGLRGPFGKDQQDAIDKWNHLKFDGELVYKI